METFGRFVSYANCGLCQHAVAEQYEYEYSVLA